jgi:hypothetical protein
MGFLNIHNNVDKFLILCQTNNNGKFKFYTWFFGLKTVLFRKKIPRL